jgi:predicted transcriptional regulator
MSPRKPDADGAVRVPFRGVRVADDLWEAAKAVAEANDETVSQVIRRALRAYVDNDTDARRANARKARS